VKDELKTELLRRSKSRLVNLIIIMGFLISAISGITIKFAFKVWEDKRNADKEAIFQYVRTGLDSAIIHMHNDLSNEINPIKKDNKMMSHEISILTEELSDEKKKRIEFVQEIYQEKEMEIPAPVEKPDIPESMYAKSIILEQDIKAISINKTDTIHKKKLFRLFQKRNN
jgi:hypothetical protein